MATEYGLRLRQARKLAGLTQVKLAELTGIAQSTISTAERENASSSDTTVFAKALGVDPHWLATGEGEMRVITATASATFPAITGSASGTVGEPLPNLERALEVLASHLDQLSNIEREAAASSLQTLARAPDSAKAKSSALDSLGAKNHTAISASAKQEIPDFLKK